MGVSAIPAGFHTITPYLVVKGAAEALEFYKTALGAVELSRMDGPEGRLMHAEFKVGDSPMMLSDECPSGQYPGPLSLGGSPVSLLLYVEDSDALFNQAIAAGAIARDAMADRPWGDRMGTLIDPFGHIWSIATHQEDVAPDEMERRMRAMMEQYAAAAEAASAATA
jgi:PhnB protein